jgi:hypothetical protein
MSRLRIRLRSSPKAGFAEALAVAALTTDVAIRNRSDGGGPQAV